MDLEDKSKNPSLKRWIFNFILQLLICTLIKIFEVGKMFHFF